MKEKTLSVAELVTGRQKRNSAKLGTFKKGTRFFVEVRDHFSLSLS
jgi:hypothetical protein